MLLTENELISSLAKADLQAINLARHVSVVHNDIRQKNPNSLLTCSRCYRSFDTRNGLVQHEKKCILIISCLKCNSWFTSKRDLETHTCNFVCSKCCVTFCSQDSLKLHFNSCEGPKIERLAEKLQITTIVDTFSCSKCDMDFDLREALKKHSGNCEIAMLQPGEEHLDHTYSKGVSTATSVKQGNLLRRIDNTTIKR